MIADHSLQQSPSTEISLIRVYGDSLSMPRRTEGVQYEDTYPELIAAELRGRGQAVHLYNRSFSGPTAKGILKTYEQDSAAFGRRGGNIAILQCGIVDCAPRPVPPLVRSIISRTPAFLRTRVISFLHEQRPSLLRAGLVWRVTPPRLFEEAVSAVVRAMGSQFDKVYVINVAPTTEQTELQSPGLMESITLYNRLLADVVGAVNLGNITLVDVHAAIVLSGVEGCISKLDGHHINKKGHRLYAELILRHGTNSIRP